MCDQRSTVIVPSPDWSGRENPLLGLDECIADVVQAAWERGVRTLGSCCGHGERRPSLVLCQDADQPDIARAVLADIDTRDWQLLQWQLIDVEIGGAS